jgi:benzoylformate decarboxylase
VVAVIGDGTMRYSIQNLYTAAQHRLKIIYVVPCNGEYEVLKQFAVLEDTPDVPGINLPGFDFVALAKGHGCIGVEAKTPGETAFAAALKADGPAVIRHPGQA